MDQLDDEVYRERNQELILQLIRREREQENMNSDQHQCLSKQSQQGRDWNKKEIRIPFSFESDPKLKFQRELRCLWKKHYQ